MYDHIGLKVKDLDASVRFYGAALAPLGHVFASQDANEGVTAFRERRDPVWQDR